MDKMEQVRAIVWACGRGQTDRQTHRRAWPQYISRGLRLTPNVIIFTLSSFQLDTVGRQEGHPACKKWGDGGGGHCLIRMEWRPAGWSVCLPLLIFPCTTKSRSSLAPAHPGGPRKMVVVVLWCHVSSFCDILMQQIWVVRLNSQHKGHLSSRCVNSQFKSLETIRFSGSFYPSSLSAIKALMCSDMLAGWQKQTLACKILPQLHPKALV